MGRHTVRLLATMGACSAFALMLSSGAGALEISTPHVNIPTPHINVPTPHINVPKPHINVPTLNLRHDWLSNRANTFRNGNKLGGGTTVNTPFVGSSDSQGSIGIKVITKPVGGSVTPTQVQQQNAAAAALAQQQHQEAAGVATGIAGASSGTGSPGGQNTFLGITLDISRSYGPGTGLNKDQPMSSGLNNLPLGLKTAAFYNSVAGGSDDAAYAADVSALQAPVTTAKGSAACTTNPNGYQCLEAVSAAENVLNDFEAYVDYLLFLLAYAENPGIGYSLTATETADIEAALQACLASPSTCAATIAQLNAELESLGVPSGYQTSFGPTPVIESPAKIAATWFDSANSPNGNLSLSAEVPLQVENAACNGMDCI